MSMLPTQFNLRVYGTILNIWGNSVLVADEFQQGMRMTKFPGGGLDFGEGIIDCLKREAIEEFGQEITNLEHYYTTDFFHKVLFSKTSSLYVFIIKPRFRNQFVLEFLKHLSIMTMMKTGKFLSIGCHLI
jgi:8-oxo-dGTP diphosphatase